MASNNIAAAHRDAGHALQPYQCHLDVAFATATHAELVKQVMQVDREPTDRVHKSFVLLNDDKNAPRILRVSFTAAEAKMLRVAVSSFCDYLQVSLRCIQEFG